MSAVGKGSKSSLKEDIRTASLSESPDDIGKAEAMPLVEALSAVESQDSHMRRVCPARGPAQPQLR